MEPGRELDALVAELFGEKPDVSPTEDSLWLIRRGSDNGGWLRSITGSDPDDCNLMVVDWLPRPFSTDIAAAWEVVEKLLGRFQFTLNSLEDGLGWYAEFGAWNEKIYQAYDENAETVPHAICLAALKAVG